MLCLAFDTSTARLAVAVGTSDRVLVSHDMWAPRDHMARLLPAARRVLEDAGGLEVTDLDAIVVGVGPGSFTGVRIGVAGAKGVARASRSPLIGVPSLDAVAEGLVAHEGPLVVVVDAARGEVYPMTYSFDGERLVRDAAFSVSLAGEAARALAVAFPAGDGLLLAGDGLAKHRDVFASVLPRARIAPEHLWYPSGAGLIRRAASLEPEQSGDPDTVLPIYTRASDAEEAAARRAGERA